MSARSYPPLQTIQPRDDWWRRIADSVRNLLDGRVNCCGSFTLANGATSTAVTEYRAHPDSVIVWMPTTVLAASTNASIYVSAQADGSFTLTHSNPGATTAVYKYVIVG